MEFLGPDGKQFLFLKCLRDITNVCGVSPRTTIENVMSPVSRNRGCVSMSPGVIFITSHGKILWSVGWILLIPRNLYGLP